MNNILNHLLNQLHSPDNKNDLLFLSKQHNCDWEKRAEQTINYIVPRLKNISEGMVMEIPKKLNASGILNRKLDEGANKFNHLPEVIAFIESIREHATAFTEITEDYESQQISASVQKYISNKLSDDLYSNSKSSHPDFVLKNLDYSHLPYQKKKNPVVGPCLKKTTNSPSNIPDGLELKSTKGSKIKVDAHSLHVGLHLGITWNFTNISEIEINGVWLAYITYQDYKKSSENVITTSPKYSFGHDPFISLI